MEAVGARESWWKASPDKCGGIVTRTCELLEGTSANRARLESRAIDRRIFEEGGVSSSALQTPEAVMSALRSFASGESMTINVTRSIVETALSRVASRQRPKPVFASHGGTWSQRQRAKKANRFIEAVFRDAQVDVAAEKVFRAAMIDGIGFVHCYIYDGRAYAEPIDSADVLVDPTEGRFEKPRSLYLTRVVDRDVLLAMAGDSEASRAVRMAIKRAEFVRRDTDGYDYTESPCADPVRVVEAWRLSSSSAAKDGRHVIAVGEHLIVDERDISLARFPVVPMRWSSALSGYYGWSLVRTLRDLQNEITYVMSRIRSSFRKLGASKVFVQRGSLSDADQLTNRTGEVVEYSGDAPPVVVAPASIGPESMTYLRFLLEEAYNQPGVSRLQATSQKPAGLSSGEALREYNDTGDDRLTTVARAYEKWHLEVAQVFVDLLSSSDGLSVYAPAGRGTTRRMAWSDVAQDRDEYVLTMQPTSMLSRDFGTRKQQLTDLVAGGMMEKEDMMRLLEMPDLDEEMDLRNAPREIADRHIEMMLDTGVQLTPWPTQDLQYAIKRIHATIALEEIETGDPDAAELELLRNYASAAEMLLAKAAAAMAPPEMPAPAGAMAPEPQPAQVIQ